MGGTREVDTANDGSYAPYLARYRSGEWRAEIFRDLILADAERADCSTFLDIGCGRGFDDDISIQQTLASRAKQYVGVEPDESVPIGCHFTTVHRCILEDAPIAPNSIDLAFAVMVIEHLAEPEHFWRKLYTVLRPGGIFWGFTVDSRSAFAFLSYWSEVLHLKDPYLRLSQGERGVDRHLNYPVHYRSNSPSQIGRFVADFTECDVINFSRVGDLGRSVPGFLRPAADGVDALGIRAHLPGSLLLVHAVK